MNGLFSLKFWYVCGSLLLLLAGNFKTQGQNIEELISAPKDSTKLISRILTGDPFSLTGSYGLNMRSYSTDALSNRQTPLSSTVFANVTAQMYQITIPMNFMLNNLDDFSHPFHRGYFDGMLSNQRNRLTRLGISPYYKWIKVHAGHRYMNFSDFTLSNHNFLGVGVELTPGKFRFSAMSGRLAKAEPIDIALDRPNLPVYRRTGWGIKVGYGTNRDFIDVMMFNARDDVNSISLTGPSEVNLQPAENLVIGLKGRKEIVKNLSLEFEIARSGHTRNAEDERIKSNVFSLDYNNALFSRRVSTSYGNAANANLSYRINKISLGAGYQRIDPQFKTFGAYFFNDDLENFTFQLSGYGIKNFSFNGSAGLQRNNLDKSRPATYKRFIMALNANYQVNTWMMGVNYSNFNSDINYVLSDNMDSLRVVIVTTDASVNISKTLTGSGGGLHNFNLRGGQQKVNQNLETPTGNPATNMYYANLGYSLRLKSKWSFNANVDYNQNTLSGIRQDRYGIGARAGKSILNDKLDLTLGSQNYKGSSPSDIRSSLQLNNTFRAMWKLSKTQSIYLQANAIRNSRTIQNVTGTFHEFIASIGYNGRFEYRPFKANKTRLKVNDNE